MSRHASGILIYRLQGPKTEIFLVHPGGPFWRGKDKAAWSIPKGEFDPVNEDSLSAAMRELHEETGFEATADPEYWGEVKLTGGKILHVWGMPGDFDPAEIRSNSIEMEWPRNLGKKIRFPEIDRASWFDCDTAREKLHKGQVQLIDLLLNRLDLSCKAD